MPHSFGYKARTRDMFARAFRKQGSYELSKYFIEYKVGDIVDIKGDGSVQKGMPHKFYHGRTGIVFNVTKSGVGVEVNKLVNGRILKKRICIRVEHCRPSRSREDFLSRVKSNESLKRKAKETGGEFEFCGARRATEGVRRGGAGRRPETGGVGGRARQLDVGSGVVMWVCVCCVRSNQRQQLFGVTGVRVYGWGLL